MKYLRLFIVISCMVGAIADQPETEKQTEPSKGTNPAVVTSESGVPVLPNEAEVATETTSTTQPESTTGNSTTTTTTTTTTHTESTTSEPPKPTTGIPTTLPPPKKGDWNVSDHEGVCIRAEFAARIEVTKDGKAQHSINIPPAETNGSSCSTNTNEQLLRLEIDEGRSILSIIFVNETKVYANVSLLYDDKLYMMGSHAFEVPRGKSYMCSSDTTMKAEMDNVTVALSFSDLKIQAFCDPKEKDFSTAEDCSSDNGSRKNAVPIALGVTLIVVVIVILLSYFICKKKSKREDYKPFH